MPSPFPGMNPYLEREGVWHDFHQTYIPALREALTPQVLPHFFVTVDEQLYLHEPEEGVRTFAGKPDLGIVRASPFPAGTSAAAAATLPTTGQCELPDAVAEREAYLAIRDRDDNEVVTIIELLSPSNKYSGSDREQYLAKRRRVLRSDAHLVEIDLLRGGPRMPGAPIPDKSYRVIVSRVEQRPKADYWSIGLRERLPTIPVPLRAPRPDAWLDLQEVLHAVYDRAGYGIHIYRHAPQPALSAEDAAWAAALTGAA